MTSSPTQSSKLKSLQRKKTMYSHHPHNGRVCWRFSLAGFWSPVWPVFPQMYPASLPLDSLDTERQEHLTNDIIDLHVKPELRCLAPFSAAFCLVSSMRCSSLCRASCSCRSSFSASYFIPALKDMQIIRNTGTAAYMQECFAEA